LGEFPQPVQPGGAESITVTRRLRSINDAYSDWEYFVSVVSKG
jgi:hypothetical protein